MKTPISVLELAFNGDIKKEFEGNSGKVYLVENKASGPKYIGYKSCKELTEDSIELFKEEILKWNSINSRYIVPIYYMHFICGEYYACMRACDGSLEDFFKEEITEVATFNYSLQIIKGLIDLKNSSIEYHQDFNPQNILFEDLSSIFNGFPPKNIDSSHRYRMMISDFAMSNYYIKDQVSGKSGGKFPFKAPEQYKGSSLKGFSPDKFALGILLCIMFSGKHPCGHTASQVLKKNPKKLKTSWETWSKSNDNIINVDNVAVKNLIGALLSTNPEERPGFDECFRIIKEQYQTLHPSEYETSMFYINYFDQEHENWPRKELKVRV